MATDKPYVINRMANKTAEVLIYEQIGESLFEEGITAKRFASDIKALGEVRRIDVRINSPGGSVFDGLAIYNTLKQHKATVVAHIDGIALSMASVIAMAADSVMMAANGLMMIHNPRMVAAGDEADLQKAINVLQKSKDGLLKAYAEKTQLPESQISELMSAETWMTADEALEFNFVDEVTGSLDVAARVNLDEVPFGIAVPAAVRERLGLTYGENDMSEKQEQQPQPATLAQLKAMHGADAEFVVEQLEAGATVNDALNALNAKLAEQLKVAGNERAQVEQELQKATEQKAEEPAPAQEEKPAKAAPKAAEGVEPLANNSQPGNAETVPAPKDPFELFAREFRRLRAEGLNADEAIARVHQLYPETKPQVASA